MGIEPGTSAAPQQQITTAVAANIAFRILFMVLSEIVLLVLVLMVLALVIVMAGYELPPMVQSRLRELPGWGQCLKCHKAHKAWQDDEEHQATPWHTCQD